MHGLVDELLGLELESRPIDGLLDRREPPLSLADAEDKFHDVDPRLLYKAQSLDIILRSKSYGNCSANRDYHKPRAGT